MGDADTLAQNPATDLGVDERTFDASRTPLR